MCPAMHFLILSMQLPKKVLIIISFPEKNMNSLTVMCQSLGDVTFHNQGIIFKDQH